MGRRKSIDQKILDFLSKPRSAEWTSAKSLAHYIREPLEHVEHYICALTDEGLIIGVRETDSGNYWVKNLWTQSVHQES